MKHKIFLVVLLFILTIGTATLADYVEPASTAPGSNTGSVLKTGPKSTSSMTYDPLGVGDGTIATLNNLDSNPATYLTNKSYAGSAGGTLGVKPDRLVVTGITGVITGKDFIVSVLDNSNNNNKSFDQYINSSSVRYNKFITDTNKPLTTPKPLEAFVAGRYISNITITKDSEITGTQSSNPYSLELRATQGFSPTTNIGMGNSCNLYPRDIGAAISYGGCPEGTYISMYKQPTFGGAVSKVNNTNSQVVAKCTYFNPSVSPASIGACFTDSSFATTETKYGVTCRTFNNSTYTTYDGCASGDTQINQTGNCRYIMRVDRLRNGKNPVIKAYKYLSGGRIPNATYTGTTSGNTQVLQLDETCQTPNDSVVFEFEAMDDYGQYSEWILP